MLHAKGRRRVLTAVVPALVASGVLAASAAAAPPTQGTVNGFAYGELTTSAPGATGCGTNLAGEPSIHVDRTNDVFLGSELGLGGGSQLWRGLSAPGGAGSSACSLEYMGSPNANNGVGASGGDIDISIANAKNAAGFYNVYVASLNLLSVNVATSQDRGTTFTDVPVVENVPVDDREWIAAYGPSTALLTYHDIATNNIDVSKSTDGGITWLPQAPAIPPTDYKAQNNELGNIVTDRLNKPAGGGFWAYQVFVAPSSSSGSNYNEAFVAVSSDGGTTFTDQPIPCSISSKSLDHNFPNVSVDPAGRVWVAWSNDSKIFTAMSSNHGTSWTCSPAVSTSTPRSIFPWLSASKRGVDLVYYGAPTTTNQTWYVYFAQNTTSTPSGWKAPKRLMPVHQGAVCEGGVSCTNGRQLFDDFGVETDNLGFAHIAYSHDAPNLGGSGTYTGYAVQQSGTTIGAPNH